MISRIHQPIQSCSDVPFNWSTCNQRSDRRDCFSEKLLEIRVFKRRWPALIEFVWIRVAPCGFVCLHVFFRSPICNQALSSYFHILVEIEVRRWNTSCLLKLGLVCIMGKTNTLDSSVPVGAKLWCEFWKEAYGIFSNESNMSANNFHHVFRCKQCNNCSCKIQVEKTQFKNYILDKCTIQRRVCANHHFL